MRVITGSARGRRLSAPQGLDVRPTVERVKEGIFSAIQFDIEGRRVLDLFAGSGQMGIEALSRGAASAVFVDHSKQALDCVRSNLQAAALMDHATVISGDYADYLRTTQEQFDLVFLDPPYHQQLIGAAMPLVCRRLSEYGIVVCETAVDESLPDAIEQLICHKRYRYGKVSVCIYRPDKGAGLR